MPVVGHWPAPGIPTGSLLGEDGGFCFTCHQVESEHFRCGAWQLIMNPLDI